MQGSLLTKRLLSHRAPSVARTMASVTTPRLRTVTPSTGEISNGRLAPRNLEIALEALHHEGIVVIENVVDTEATDRLIEAMLQDTKVLVARGKAGPFNYNLVFTNSVASQVTGSWLGGRPNMSFISSNVALKAEQGQPVHSDADFEHPTIPFAAVVNVGLVDMYPENGSTQIWLGTHNATELSSQEGLHGERGSGRIRQNLLDQRALVSPPLQPMIQKGSIIIRDLKLWHAGMPNKTDEVRIMLAMIHFAPWYQQRMTMRLPRSLRPLLDGNEQLGVVAHWEDGSVDHMAGSFGNSFEFDRDT